MIMKRLDHVVLQMLAVNALRSLKKFYPLNHVVEDLSKKGIRVSTVDVSRYIAGNVLPKPTKAYEILKFLLEERYLEKILTRRAVVNNRGVVNITSIAYDMDIIKLATAVAYILLSSEEVDNVLTAAVNGVPLAFSIAEVLGSKLSVAKHEIDAGIESYIEERYFAPDPPRYAYLYLPSYSLRRGERILIVDDLLHSGRTLKALVNIATKAGAEVIGIFSLMAVGTAWKGSIPKSAKKVFIGKILKREG